MQDNFNSAPTSPQIGAGQAHPQAGWPAPPTPSPAPAPAAPPVYQPAPQPGDPTRAYNGPIYGPDAPTVVNPPLPRPPVGQAPVSPSAPTVYRPLPPGPPTVLRVQGPVAGYGGYGWQGGYAPPGAPAPVAPIPQAPVPAPYPPQGGYPQGGYAPPVGRAAARVAPRSTGSRRAAQRRRWLPVPHTLLLLGVAALFVAMRLPWGVDPNGALVSIQTATIPQLARAGGDGAAAPAAANLVTLVAGLSVGLLLFNSVLRGIYRALGSGIVGGCVTALFYPILIALVVALLIAQVAAGGFGALGDLGASSAHFETGYVAWYTGLAVNVAGMLGELFVGGRR